MRTVEQMVKHFQEMRSFGSRATTSMLREVKQQYVNMAEGGDGGQLSGFDHGTTCRAQNYNGYPDSFFRTVCERMGWLSRKDTMILDAYPGDPI